MKVSHVTSVHHPFDTRIFYRQCQTLAEAGYDVVLVAPWHEATTRSQVRIHPLNIYPNRAMRFFGGMIKAYRAAHCENAAVYHIHDPELLGLALLLRVQGYHVIYDVHEDLPNQIAGKYWIPEWLKPGLSRLVGKAEEVGSRFLTAIVAATPIIAERFPAERTVTIHNFPIIDELIDAEQTIPYEERPFNITYVGAIARLRGAVEMVEAMCHVAKGHPSAILNLVGSCRPESLKSELEMMVSDGHVVLWGQQDRPVVRDILGQSRVGMVTLHPTQSYLDSYPVKLFEYMAVGIPVIASDFPLWRQIVEGAQCGLLVDPQSPQEIAQAIAWLFDHPSEAEAMGKRGQQAVMDRYNWRSEEQKLLDLYEKLPPPRQRRSSK